MFLCLKYLCVVVLKPLCMLIVRNTNHTCNSHINVLVISLPQLQIDCQKLCREKSVLITNRYDLTIIFHKSILNWICNFERLIL